MLKAHLITKFIFIEMNSKKFKICGVGAGILGVPICSVIASKCPEFSVSVVDNNKIIIDQWNRGSEYPITEVSIYSLFLLSQCSTNVTIIDFTFSPVLKTYLKSALVKI